MTMKKFVNSFEDFLNENLNESISIDWRVDFEESDRKQVEERALSELSRKLVKTVEGFISETESEVEIALSNGDKVTETYEFKPHNAPPAKITLIIDGRKIESGSNGIWDDEYLTNYEGLVESLLRLYVDFKLGLIKKF